MGDCAHGHTPTRTRESSLRKRKKVWSLGEGKVTLALDVGHQLLLASFWEFLVTELEWGSGDDFFNIVALTHEKSSRTPPTHPLNV